MEEFVRIHLNFLTISNHEQEIIKMQMKHDSIMMIDDDKYYDDDPYHHINYDLDEIVEETTKRLKEKKSCSSSCNSGGPGNAGCGSGCDSGSGCGSAGGCDAGQGCSGGQCNANARKPIVLKPYNGPPPKIKDSYIASRNGEPVVGVICKRCSSYNEYAVPNMEDETYLCYSCRKEIEGY